MVSKVVEFERVADQAPGCRRDDDVVDSSHPLESGRQVGRLADRQAGARGIAGAGLADHHMPGRDTDANVRRVRRLDPLHRVDNIERRAHRANRVILMGLRPAEIDHQTVTEILRDVAVIALDDRRASLPISVQKGPQVFRVKLFGQRRRAHQVAKHDGDLPALRCRRAG